MKKLLLLASTAAVLSSSVAYADLGVGAGTEGAFFVKAEGGMANFTSVKFNVGPDFDGTTARYSKSKKSWTGTGAVGVGYYVMDNLRSELAFRFFPGVKRKLSDVTWQDKTVSKFKSKAEISAVMLSLYGSVDLSMVEAFFGAGVGMARIRDKLTTTDSKGVITSESNKMKNNVAFHARAGISAPLNEEKTMVVDGFYDFAVYGKAKKKKDGLQDTPNHRAHQVGAGLRFCF